MKFTPIAFFQIPGGHVPGQTDYCVYSLASHLAKTQLDALKHQQQNLAAGGGGTASSSGAAAAAAAAASAAATLSPYPQTPPPPYSVTPPPPYSDTPPSSISPLPQRKSYAAALLSNSAFPVVGAAAEHAAAAAANAGGTDSGTDIDPHALVHRLPSAGEDRLSVNEHLSIHMCIISIFLFTLIYHYDR